MKTLGDLLKECLDYRRSLNGSEHTLRNLRYVVTSFLNWVESHYNVRTADRLRSDHLHAWFKELSSHITNKGLPLKPRSMNAKISEVRVYLLWLARRGLIASTLVNALAYVKEPKLLPTSVLEHHQVRKILKGVDTTTAQGYRDRVLLELLYSSGLRAAEILGLNMADVDFERATAMVMGKGQKQRVVPIGKTAIRMLESYIRAVRPFLSRDPKETALFLNYAGKRLPYYTLLCLVRRWSRKVKLDIRVSPHTFRRSCTTELIRGGANLYHVKELLGHETLDTLKHYAKLTIEDLRKTHEKCHPREKGG